MIPGSKLTWCVSKIVCGRLLSRNGSLISWRENSEYGVAANSISIVVIPQLCLQIVWQLFQVCYLQQYSMLTGGRWRWSIASDSNKLLFCQQRFRINGHGPLKHNLPLIDEDLKTALFAGGHAHSIQTVTSLLFSTAISKTHNTHMCSQLEDALDALHCWSITNCTDLDSLDSDLRQATSALINRMKLS